MRAVEDVDSSRITLVPGFSVAGRRDGRVQGPQHHCQLLHGVHLLLGVVRG